MLSKCLVTFSFDEFANLICGKNSYAARLGFGGAIIESSAAANESFDVYRYVFPMVFVSETYRYLS